MRTTTTNVTLACELGGRQGQQVPIWGLRTSQGNLLMKTNHGGKSEACARSTTNHQASGVFSRNAGTQSHQCPDPGHTLGCPGLGTVPLCSQAQRLLLRDGLRAASHSRSPYQPDIAYYGLSFRDHEFDFSKRSIFRIPRQNRVLSLDPQPTSLIVSNQSS